MRRFWTILGCIFAFWGLWGHFSALGMYFRLDGDRLWLQTDQTPLLDVLNEFARAGVDVWADPKLQGTLTGSIRGEEVSAGLKQILTAQDYLLTWKVLRGPLGGVPKLKEIRIFTPGEASAARPMPRRKRTFEMTRGVTGQGPEFVRDELLLGVRPGTTYAQFRHLLDQVGGMLVESQDGVYLVRFARGTNVEALLEQLRNNAIVAHAELNYGARLPKSAASAAAAAEIAAVSPPPDGSIPVAVLDSGLDPNSPAAALLYASLNAVDPESTLSDPLGHGTQMALLASGATTADGWSAADSTLPVVAIRTFDENGVTSDFALLQALAYAEKSGAKVVNMSWGSSTDSDFIRAALQEAAKRGMVLVAAAGNEGTSSTAYYPAAYDGVLAVAGVTAAGTPWESSNSGSYVDLSAPATSTTVSGNTRTGMAGTSVSSAAVAGAISRYLNTHAEATGAEAVAALNSVLSETAGAGFGVGTLDEAALRRYLALP